MPYPPLGTIYAAALLRENGHEVALFDTMFSHGSRDLLPSLEKFDPDLLVIYDDGFNYLTKMCLTNMREAAFEMSKFAKERGCKVVCCSSDSTDHFEKYLAHGADVIIRGEGEIGLLELVRNWSNGVNDLNEVLGIAYMNAGEVRQNPDRPVLRDLDSLPAPAWDLVNITSYQNAWSDKGYFSINMATTRGCPYKCNWCAKPIYGNRYNSHSPEAKADELTYLVKEFGVQHVWFCDDIFGLKPGWVQGFAEAILKRRIRVRFKIQSRADLLLKDGTVEALAQAGCEEVWLGAESGSQKILDSMDKGITVAEIHESRRILKFHGIRAAFFLQFGYLGETQNDIKATLEMLADTMPDDIGVSVSYPLPGTPFYEKVKNDLGQKANWTDSDELALMFRNNHSRSYYKQLHRYVHKYYRKLQAFEAFGKIIRLSPTKEDLRRAASAAYYIPAAFVEGQRLKRMNNS